MPPGQASEQELKEARDMAYMAKQPPMRAPQECLTDEWRLLVAQAPEQELKDPGNMAAIGETAIDEGRQHPQT